MHLSVHRPEFYLPAIAEEVQLPQRKLAVNVYNEGDPVTGNPVSMAASQVAFPGGGSPLPTQTQATGRTDENGVADFPINPLANKAFDQTDFTATTTIEGEEYTCTATVVAGFGTLLAPYLENLEEIANTLALVDRIQEEVFAYLPATEEETQRFKKELFALLRTEVFREPDTYRRLLDGLREHRPGVRAFLNGEKTGLDPRLLKDLREVIPFLIARGGPAVRQVATSMAKAYPILLMEASDENQEAGRNREVASRLPPARQLFGKLPLSFEKNIGQTDPAVDYFARGPGYGVYLTPRQAVLVRGKSNEYGDRERSVVRMALVRSNEEAAASSADELPGKSHYLIGNDPAGWYRNIPQSAKVRYEEVYPGIDLVYYGNLRRLEFDFVVTPGADPGRVKLTFPETERVEVGEDGELILASPDYFLTLAKPVVYQETGGGRREIESAYRLARDGSVGFRLGAYDPRHPLIIDPVLEYSSYLGGIGDDTPTDIAVDPEGNVFIAGTTGSADFPVNNPLQAGLAEGGFVLADAFVMKLDPTGKTQIYSTYLGGNHDDSALGIAVDAGGNALVTGMTSAADFPVEKPVQAAYGNGESLFGSDAFVAKLNATGSALAYSTYLGGSGFDTGHAIGVDAGGSVVVVGSTSSMDLAVVAPLQGAHGGGSELPLDVLIAKLGPQGNAVFVSYLGGAGDDAAHGVALDAKGDIYLAGQTTSEGFPVVNPAQENIAGANDAFVSKISSSGQAMLYSTFIGGASDDAALDIAVDQNGHAYLTGSTGSGNFPLAPEEAPLQGALASADQLGLDAFVTKLSADGAILAYSTYLGGAGTELGHGIAVDADGAAYVGGETDSADFPTMEALQTMNAGETDGFILKLDPAGTALEFASYIGGSGGDAVASVAVDSAKNVYLTGASMSVDVPLTAGAFQTVAGGSLDGFVAKLTPGESVPGPQFNTASIVSAANFTGGRLAAEMWVALFGQNLATELLIPENELPTSLGGTSISVTDSEGVRRPAKLQFVAPERANFLIPTGTATGRAAVEVTNAEGASAVAGVQIEVVAPGLFSANADGQGPAAATFLRIDGSGARSEGFTFVTDQPAGSRTNVPIDLGPETDQVYLSFFGTGFRGQTSASVQIGGVDVPVVGAVAQGQFEGLDQAVAGPLPRTLIGQGEANVEFTFDGVRANTVTVNIQ